jgi:hypothetical protein
MSMIDKLRAALAALLEKAAKAIRPAGGGGNGEERP